jgi:predicted RNase H-like HicB family nuclease
MEVTSHHAQYEGASSGITMERKKYVFWQADDMWLGYLDEYPDYMTQGETLEELKENLMDIFNELNSGIKILKQIYLNPYPDIEKSRNTWLNTLSLC